METKQSESRYYWKCNDCLIPVVLDAQWHARATYPGIVCKCGGSMLFMGKIKGDRYIKTELKCDCDDRCTSARGPDCDCKCGGENHGKSLEAYHKVILASGKIEVASNHDDCIDLGRAWQALATDGNAAYNAKYAKLLEMKKNGEWIERKAFLEMVDSVNEYHRICAMKMYKSREKKMREYIANMNQNSCQPVEKRENKS